MSTNFPADMNLTQEQECLKRLLLMGRLIKVANPASDYYVTTPQYNRFTATATTSTRAPRETYQITFDLDADALDQALNCGSPLYLAAKALAGNPAALVCAIATVTQPPNDQPAEPSGLGSNDVANGTP